MITLTFKVDIDIIYQTDAFTANLYIYWTFVLFESFVNRRIYPIWLLLTWHSNTSFQHPTATEPKYRITPRL